MQENLTEREKRDNVDKIKNNQNLDSALIVKLILALFCLLTAAFVSGVVIGKNGRRSIDRTSADEEGINEKLAACIFNSDELRGKYLKLRDVAREMGIVDENDVINMKIVCSNGEQKTVESKSVEKPVETKKAETFQETSLQEKTAERPAESKPAEQKNTEKPEDKKVETKSTETFQETSLREKNKPDKNKTVDKTLTEKKPAAKKEDKPKCRFSIQIFAANTKEQADAAAKKLKALKPRVISGENNGKKWFKLRSGCFDSREAAEAGLQEVKKTEKSAYIVSE